MLRNRQTDIHHLTDIHLYRKGACHEHAANASRVATWYRGRRRGDGISNSAPGPGSAANENHQTKVISHQPHLYHGWPTLARRRNGELLLVCSGGRQAHVCPFGRVELMRSKDDGQTWGDKIILRSDGASWDLGYPRTVLRPDGKCVTVYYFHPKDRNERIIAATIWDPLAKYND